MVIRNSYTIADYYESYKEYTKNNEAYYIEYSKFREILTDYFKFLAEELIDNCKEIRLPARMGTLSVVKARPKRYDYSYLRVDFNGSRSSDKTLLHLNEHSGGFNYRFYWNKRDILIQNRSMYELVMSRANKRRLAYMIKIERKDYIEK